MSGIFEVCRRTETESRENSASLLGSPSALDPRASLLGSVAGRLDESSGILCRARPGLPAERRLLGYCEHQWKRSKPAVYPSFREWLKASEQCGDEVLDKYEMREEKRRLIKLPWRVSPRTLREAVERYVEWEVFAFWTRTALEGEFPLPATVQMELKRRCPGFLAAEAVERRANPKEEPHCRFNRLVKWIGDHKFTNARKEGWLDVLLYQARLHARHARVTDYWHDWEAEREKHPTGEYPLLGVFT